MAELRRLADKCQFGRHLEEALRDRLVCGLRNVATQKLLLAQEDLTLTKAYETAMGMEMAAKQAGHLQGQQVEGTPSVLVVRNRPGQGPPRSQRQPLGQGNTCFRCGKSGHGPEKCFFKRQKCRQCGRYGHIQRMCQSKRVALVEEQDQEYTLDQELGDED